jgi:hypothetical protein
MTQGMEEGVVTEGSGERRKGKNSRTNLLWTEGTRASTAIVRLL